MREIKFRAWDKVSKVMVNGLVLDFQGNILVTKKRGPDGKYAFKQQEGYDRERFELMQYTGLQDKNGKEIYESDLGKPEIEKPHLVSWIGDRWQKGDWDYANGRWTWGDIPRDFEVIGNIYENPELLN